MKKLLIVLLFLAVSASAWAVLRIPYARATAVALPLPGAFDLNDTDPAYGSYCFYAYTPFNVTVSWTASSNAADYVVTLSDFTNCSTYSSNPQTVSSGTSAVFSMLGTSSYLTCTITVVARNATGNSEPVEGIMSLNEEAA